MDEVRAELVGNILPFWSTVALDPVRGGVHGTGQQRTRRGRHRRSDGCGLRPDDLGVLRCGPASSAIRAGWSPPQPSATPCSSTSSIRSTAGSSGPCGPMARSRRTASSCTRRRSRCTRWPEYGRTSGATRPAVQQAMELFGQIERNGADPVGGGYLEACGRGLDADRRRPAQPARPQRAQEHEHDAAHHGGLHDPGRCDRQRPRPRPPLRPSLRPSSTASSTSTAAVSGCSSTSTGPRSARPSPTATTSRAPGCWSPLHGPPAMRPCSAGPNVPPSCWPQPSATTDATTTAPSCTNASRAGDGTPEVIDRGQPLVGCRPRGAVGFLEAARITGDRSFADAASALLET